MPPEGLSKATIYNVCKKLSSHYPKTRLSNKKNPLLEAIFILLSGQTDEKKYLSTWKMFRQRFPRIECAERASVKAIYQAIQEGGLGYWKAERIYNLLKQTKEKYHQFSLSPLKDLDDSNLEKELLALDGIGIKSARCIMMYSFDREVFPVDTHALRILRRLGFRIPKYSKRSKKFADYLQNQVPKKHRVNFHINLVQHGREVCKIRPHCNICPVNRLCKEAAAKTKK